MRGGPMPSQKPSRHRFKPRLELRQAQQNEHGEDAPPREGNGRPRLRREGPGGRERVSEVPGPEPRGQAG